MTMLFQHEVEVAWLTMGGTRCRGQLVLSDSTRAPLRIRQHQAFTDPTWRVTWARWLAAALIQSQLRAARHYQRHGCAGAGEVVRRLNEAKMSAATVTLEQLRGVEGGRARGEAAALEVYLGYHDYRAGRPSLAFDVMELLRIPVVDRWVIGLCHQGQVSPSHFGAHEGGFPRTT